MVYLYILMLTPNICLGQTSLIEKINGQFVLTEGKFSLITDKGNIILMKNLRTTDENFAVIEELGKPIEIIEKKNFVEQTKEFVYDNFRIRYSNYGKWRLEYMELKGNYGVVATDISDSLISNQVFQKDTDFNEHVAKMSNGRIAKVVDKKVKLRKYAMMYSEDRKIIKQIDKNGNPIIDHWVWVELTLDKKGNITKLEYFIDNDT